MRTGLLETSPEKAGLSRAGLDAVNAAVQTQIDTGGIAGAVTLTLRRGQLVDLHTMGVRTLETGEPMTADTIFRIFSMTKPVTATAMMILRDEGRWRPSDPIALHLPELSDLAVFDASGQPEIVPAEHQPTLAELLTHQAGFAYGLPIGDPADEIERRYRAADIWAAPDLADFTARIARLPLAHQPGTRWRYSLSMDLQGALIERLSGQSLPNFFRTRIFEPLGMTDTAFHVPPEKQDRLAGLLPRGRGPACRHGKPSPA